jgi:hypothetical protein
MREESMGTWKQQEHNIETAAKELSIDVTGEVSFTSHWEALRGPEEVAQISVHCLFKGVGVAVQHDLLKGTKALRFRQMA